MEKIDRLGWADGISFTSYGVRIGIRVNRTEALERIKEHLPPGWKFSRAKIVDRLYSLIIGGSGAKPNVRRFNILYADLLKIARTLDLDAVLDTLESDLQLYVAEEARRRVFVHAGVVAWDGQAIVIPGRSHSGKTTLVTEFVRAGAVYYSDEYAVLDQQGRVHPYPRPLGIREGDSSKQTKYPVEEIGGRAGIKPLPVGMVVVSKYRNGARWRPRKLTPGQGALALLDNTVSARRQPEKALSAFKHIVPQAVVLKGERGEASEVVNSILTRIMA